MNKIAYSVENNGEKVFHSSVSPAVMFGTHTVDGIDVDTFQLSVLTDACYHGELQTVEKQLSLMNEDLSYTIDPLKAAIKGDHLAIVERLVGSTIDDHMLSENMYCKALSFATRLGRWKAVALMLPRWLETVQTARMLRNYVLRSGLDNENAPPSIVPLIAQRRTELEAIEMKEALACKWAKNIRQIVETMAIKRHTKWRAQRKAGRAFRKNYKKWVALEEKAITEGTCARGGATHKRDVASWSRMSLAAARGSRK